VYVHVVVFLFLCLHALVLVANLFSGHAAMHVGLIMNAFDRTLSRDEAMSSRPRTLIRWVLIKLPAYIQKHNL
jgi:hypothetical protein